MSKTSILYEIGTSPIEEEVTKLCCDLVDSVCNKNSEEAWDYRSGKKTASVETFPFLREDILKFLQDYFVDEQGPREYDYHLEKIYDEFRVNKMTLKEEGKWNVDGLTEFLRNADLTEISRKSISSPNIEKVEAVDESTDVKSDEDDLLEFLCNMFYGITLEELRALEERGSDIEYWPGPEKFTSKGEVSFDDNMILEDLADKMTSEDLADEIISEDLADEITSENLADEITPEDLAYEMTSEDLPDEMTSEDLADEMTSEDLADEIISEDLADEITSENLADEITPEDLADEMTSEDLPDEMTSEDLADKMTSEDLAEEVSTRDHLQPVFKEEKSTEDPEGQPKNSDEKSKKKKKRCSWLKNILCCFNCFKCAKSEDD